MFHGPWMWLLNSIVRFALLTITFTAIMLSYMFIEEERSYKPKQRKSLTSLINHYFYFGLLWISNHVWCTIERAIGSLQCKCCKCKLSNWTRSRTFCKGRMPIQLHTFHSLAMSTSTSQTRYMQFDMDSRPLRIDNCASRSISNYIGDFIAPPKPSPHRITGIGGAISDIKVGTVRWNIEDDQGQVHVIKLPNTFYAPTSPSSLLSPQHWAQVAKDNYPRVGGTCCITYDRSIVLQWSQWKFTQTIPLHPTETNVATIRTAPGYTQYHAFTTESQYNPHAEDKALCYAVGQVSDDE